MASRRHARRRGCQGKIRHASAGGAYGAAQSLNRRGCSFVEGYRCGACGFWHVGHVRRGRMARENRDWKRAA